MPYLGLQISTQLLLSFPVLGQQALHFMGCTGLEEGQHSFLYEVFPAFGPVVYQDSSLLSSKVILVTVFLVFYLQR